MKCCQLHWDKLRQSIIDNGMGHLIAPSGEDAIKRMEKELRGEIAVFDPLITAYHMITSNAIRVVGIPLMALDDSGNHYCPLCEIKKSLGEGEDEEWVKNATNGCLEYCGEENLLNQN